MAHGETYEEFVDKFKPKKTTDDCYTPPNIYDALLAWVKKEYGLAGETPILRPFRPGGDYEAADYPADGVVVDNPPFSILLQIIRFYSAHGVRYFLFAPSLTVFSCIVGNTACAIIADAAITYENGAVVRTAFVTNLDDAAARAVPELASILKKAEEENRREKRRELPKYTYPDEVLMATNLQRFAKYGIDYRVSRADCVHIRALDAQRPAGKTLYGAGLLLSEKAAAEKAAAEKAAAEKAAAHVWQLSERERAIIDAMI